jgi:hypothetical protein
MFVHYTRRFSSRSSRRSRRSCVTARVQHTRASGSTVQIVPCVGAVLPPRSATELAVVGVIGVRQLYTLVCSNMDGTSTQAIAGNLTPHVDRRMTPSNSHLLRCSSPADGTPVRY